MTSDFIIKFGSFLPTNFFDLTDFPKGRNDKEIINEVESNVRGGVEILASRHGMKIIELQFFSNRKTVQEIDVLIGQMIRAGIQELSFSDEEEFVYYAKLDGALTFYRELEDKSVRGTIFFIVPDGFKHAKNPSGPFTAVQDEDGRYFVEVENNGTADTPITMTATMNAENGYIGMYTDYATTEIGNREELDTVVKPFSRTVIGSLSDFGTSSSNSPLSTSYYLNNGSLELTGSGLKLKTKGNVVDVCNGGARIKSFTPQADVTSFYSYFEINFRAVKYVTQTGIIQVLFTDVNGKLIGGYRWQKTAQSVNTALCIAHVGGNNPREVYKKTFVPSHLPENPFKAGENAGPMDFYKEGSKIRFHWCGSYPSVTVPELANVDVARCYIYFGQYGTRNLSTTQYIGECLVRELFARENYTKEVDVRNRYAKGKKIKMTGADGKVYVNGMLRLSEKHKKSNLFTIPPGKTKIYFECSEWCEVPPTYQIEFQERSI